MPSSISLSRVVVPDLRRPCLHRHSIPTRSPRPSRRAHRWQHRLFATFLTLGFASAHSAHAALTMGIELGPVPAHPGEQLAVEITVTNTDAVSRTGVVLELVLPSGIETFNRALLTGPFTSGSCGQIDSVTVCTSSETIIWSLATLFAGQSATVTLPPVVGAVADGTTITFSPTVVDSQAIVIGVNDSTTVQSTREVEVAIDEVFQPVAAIDALHYLIDFGNRSTAVAATNAVLRLPLPTGTSFVAASDGGALVGSTIAWTLGTLAPGESGRREVELATGALARGTLLVANATLEDDLGESRASAITEIDGAEALTLGLEVGPDPARPGERLAVEATVTNLDSVNHTGVILTLRLPEGIDTFNRALLSGPITSASCGQIDSVTICSSGEQIDFNLATLLPGQSMTMTLPPIVSASDDGRLFSFCAVVHGSGADDRAAASRTIAVDSTHVLEVSIDEVFQPVASGGALEYVLHYANASTSTSATNAALQLPLPADTSFVSASDGGALVAGVITWPLGTLAAGESGQREVALVVSSVSDGTLLYAAPSLEDDLGESRAETITEVDAAEDLMLGLEVGPDPARPGERLAVEATVTNLDSVNHSGVTLTLRLPDGIDTFNRALLSGPISSASCGQIDSVTICSSGEQIDFSLATLLPGQSATMTLPPIVSASDDGRLFSFRAEVHGSGAADRASASRTIAVDSTRVLEVSIDEVFQPVASGGALEYVLHYANASPSTSATNAVLRLPLPADTSFVSASDSGTLVGSSIEWTLGTLAPGESGRREVALDVSSVPDGTLLYAAPTLEDDLGESRAQTITEVDAAEVLMLGLEVGPDPARPGERLAIEATVTNLDSVSHAGVILTVRLPEGINTFNRGLLSGPFISDACGQIDSVTVCSSGEQIDFLLATLAPGQSATVTLPAHVSAQEDGALIRFAAEVHGSTNDDRAAASRTVPVRSTHRFELSLHESRNPVAAGASLEYVLRFANTSPSQNATNTLLRLVLPPEASFVSATGGGVLIGDRVEWSLGTVLAKGYGERRASVTIAGDAPEAGLISALASIESDTRVVDEETITEIDSDEALQLSFGFVSTPGQRDHLEATVTNVSAVNRTGAGLVVRLPADIDSFPRTNLVGPFSSASCGQIDSVTLCSSGELVSFVLGTLGPGASAVFALPPLVSRLPDGVLINVEAVASATGADDRASKTIPEPEFAAMLGLGVAMLLSLGRVRTRRVHHARHD